MIPHDRIQKEIIKNIVESMPIEVNSNHSVISIVIIAYDYYNQFFNHICRIYNHFCYIFNH